LPVPGFQDLMLPVLEELADGVDHRSRDLRERLGELLYLSPAELIETSYQALRKDLAAQILTAIKGCSPSFFERLVVELLLAMGYGGSMADAGSAVGQSGDGGIDGIIKEDRLGLDAVYVQAKRWDGTVGRPVVQSFVGSLEGKRARKGVMISTSQFSKDAHDFVAGIEKRIVLIDGEKLADLMIEYGIGVTEVAGCLADCSSAAA